MIHIGVDPGKTGAIAIKEGNKIEIFDFEQEYEIVKRLRAVPAGTAHAVIEKVSAMPKQGVVSVFSFGTNFGYWQGVLKALLIPYDLITPQKWQGVMFDFRPSRKLGMKDAEWARLKKEFSRARAKNLFPCCAEKLTRKKDHNRSDALLIMGYCERIHGGKGVNLDDLW
jgi:crossover junction endodeoxyribonuclease RuvC